MSQQVATPSETKRPRLRWYQFSLRSLLLFVTLCAVACSWLGVQIQEGRRQYQAAEAIKKAGGMATTEPTWLGRLFGGDLVTVTSVELPNSHLSDRLHDLPQVRTLFLTQVTDADLTHLVGMHKLTKLWVQNARITDEGLKSVGKLEQLEDLCLGNTKIGDAGLQHLPNHLGLLSLNGAGVTDEGLVSLKRLNLTWLSLADTGVSDAGLRHLEGMSQLGWLDVWKTKVTDEGVKRLQKALPNCKIAR